MNASPAPRALAPAWHAMVWTGFLFGAAPISHGEELAAGFVHTCAIAGDGVSCWGRNEFGQLGNGGTSNANAPAGVFGLHGNVGAIAAGDYFSCAIVDGGLACWGLNAAGQLGNGSNATALMPVGVPGFETGVERVAAGRQHTCAIRNGALSCWGNNGHGQLGDGTTGSSSVPVAVPGFESGVTDVATGFSHTCAASSQNVYCWGANTHGQLGTADGADHPSPMLVTSLSGAVDVAVGDAFSCALLSNGQAKCWGDNGDGQLGDGTGADSAAPVVVNRLLPTVPPTVVPLSNLTRIAAGNRHACAADATHVYCWGEGDLGEIGNGSARSVRYASLVGAIPAATIDAIAAGGAHSCARAAGATYCWGSDENGQLGIGGYPSIVPSPAVSGGLTGPQSPIVVAAGATHGCALRGPSVVCWGANGSGEIGDGTIMDQAAPVPVQGLSGTGLASPSAGASHSCAVQNDQVRCWGANASGQLGGGFTSEMSMTPVLVGVIGQIDAVAAGGLHSCAFGGFQGNVWCWGSNSSGQLGSNDTPDSYDPVSVLRHIDGIGDLPVASANAIVAGDRHSCARVGSALYCWGGNDRGQLGNNSTQISRMAVPVTGLGFDSALVGEISAGREHTCAVVGAEGKVQCWGANTFGQLGDGTTSDSPVPLYVKTNGAISPSLTGAVDVAAGTRHTCAVVTGGVLCWGDNTFGELGAPPSLQPSTRPVTAIPPLSGVVGVSVGDDYSCAVEQPGGNTTRTLCWGHGLHGVLANGVLGYSALPAEVDFDHILTDGFELP